jgi:hypothetical protein
MEKEAVRVRAKEWESVGMEYYTFYSGRELRARGAGCGGRGLRGISGRGGTDGSIAQY